MGSEPSLMPRYVTCPTSLEHIGNHPVIVGGGFAPDLPFEPRPPHRRDYHEAEEVRLDSPLEGGGFELSVPGGNLPELRRRLRRLTRTGSSVRNQPKCEDTAEPL